MPYGMPYRGSKSQIAYKLLSMLPAGERFVDLFGGGGAMSHAAVLSGKYNSVLYNEIQPRVVDCFHKAVSGYFDNFIPDWISKEEFHERRASDGYIAICWSYGGNMRSYLYSDKKAAELRPVHDFIVYGTGGTMHERKLKTKTSMRHLESLARLSNLSGLPVDINCGSYEEYIYRPGDVVYCDIPYEASYEGYKTKFDKQDFIKWALSRPYPVYISEYECPLVSIWELEKTCMFFSPLSNKKNKVIERLYINREEANNDCPRFSAPNESDTD